jgi:hypothetical protein
VSDEEKAATSADDGAGSGTRTEAPASKTGDDPDAAAFAAVRASWGYPAFARRFPRDPELDALVTAFTRGDYHAVRERAPKLAASSADADVKRAAELLRQRIEPDPTSKILLLLAATLLAFLTVWWVTHDGPEGARPITPAKPAPTQSTPTDTLRHDGAHLGG